MRWGDIIISAGMASLAASFYGLATFTQSINPVDPGPAFYPRIVSFLLFVAACAQMVRAWREGGVTRSGDRSDWREAWSAGAFRYTLGTLTVSVAYVSLFDKVPYLIGAAGFLLVLMVLGGVRGWLVLSGAALGYALLTYYVFGQILMVPLP